MNLMWWDLGLELDGGRWLSMSIAGWCMILIQLPLPICSMIRCSNSSRPGQGILERFRLDNVLVKIGAVSCNKEARRN